VGLERDDLFLVIIVKDSTEASVYRAMIKSEIIKPEKVKDPVAVY
jgi:hypothetical protein